MVIICAIYHIAIKRECLGRIEKRRADEVTTSGDGGTNAAVGADMLETERSDSQPSQA
eukprot:COSAG04_NODE_2300_length_4366_cov_4.363956_1_plen_57_part_10